MRPDVSLSFREFPSKFIRADPVSERLDAVYHNDGNVVLIAPQQDGISFYIDFFECKLIGTIRLAN